mmetsp:Transcript_42271/g.105289  ORF Transcript_42271/g.105289 Transcript_42271/m.105289 type:complete len:96 (+) Transcript_42271:211-498(+)
MCSACTHQGCKVPYAGRICQDVLLRLFTFVNILWRCLHKMALRRQSSTYKSGYPSDLVTSIDTPMEVFTLLIPMPVVAVPVFQLPVLSIQVPPPL